MDHDKLCACAIRDMVNIACSVQRCSKSGQEQADIEVTASCVTALMWGSRCMSLSACLMKIRSKQSCLLIVTECLDRRTLPSRAGQCRYGDVGVLYILVCGVSL